MLFGQVAVEVGAGCTHVWIECLRASVVAPSENSLIKKDDACL